MTPHDPPDGAATQYPQTQAIPQVVGESATQTAQRAPRSDGYLQAALSGQGFRGLSNAMATTLAHAAKAIRGVEDAFNTFQAAQEQLQVIGERLQALIAVTGTIYWVTDAQGQPTDASPWCEFTGQTMEQVRNGGWLDAVHPDDRAQTITAWEETLAAKLPYVAEYRALRKDGVYRDFLSRAAPIYDDQGTVREWVGICFDVTDRKQVSRDLLASERKYRAAFEHAPLGVTHIAPDGRLLLVNEQMCVMLGYTREELLHLTTQDITHSEDWAEDAAQISACLAGTTDTYRLEKRYRRHDNSDIWANLTRSLVRDELGEPLYFITIIEDITYRKQLEHSLAEKASQLEAVFEAISDSVFVFDEHDRLVLSNLATREMFGFPSPASERNDAGYEQSLRNWWRDIKLLDLNGVPLPEGQTPSARALRGEIFSGAGALEARVRVPSGAILNLDMTAAPIRQNGQVRGAVVVARDVTERRRLERQRMDLLRVVAHDLANPLTAMQYYLYRQRGAVVAAQAAEDAPGEAVPTASQRGAAGLLDTAEHAAFRMKRLIQELQLAARIEQGGLLVRKQRGDLADLVRLEVALAKAATEREIQATLPEGPILVEMDASHLGQALANLLSNATKYSLPERPLALTVTVDGAEVTVSVRDEGRGIPASEMRRIWDQFYRVREESAETDIPNGLGLGLFITRGVIEAHDGVINAESVVGEGSTFWFTLPLAPAAVDDEAGDVPVTL